MLEGEFKLRDFIKFNFNGKLLERKIIGIDTSKKILNNRPNVGIMIESLDEKESDDLRNWNPQNTIGRIYQNRK